VRLGIATLLGASAAALAGPSAVLADCAVPPELKVALATAQVAFVGTVNRTEGDDRWAHVDVEEIWSGPDLPETVVVVGALVADGVTPDDRTFRAGVRYLFLPTRDADGTLRDNGCTSTTEWIDEMAIFRPESARAPKADPASGFLDALLPVGVALLAALGLLLIGFAARGREGD
jgi:hypothetical protein